MSVKLPAENWGWKLQNGMYEPVMTDLAPAPEKILKFVRCNCKLTAKKFVGQMHALVERQDCDVSQCVVSVMGKIAIMQKMTWIAMKYLKI